MKKIKIFTIIELVCCLFLCASCSNNVKNSLNNVYERNEKITLEYNENYNKIYDYSQYGQKIILERTDDDYQVKINGNVYQRDNYEYIEPYNFLVLDDGFLLMDKNYFVLFDNEGKEKEKYPYSMSEQKLEMYAISYHHLLNLNGQYFIATRNEWNNEKFYKFYKFSFEDNQITIDENYSLFELNMENGLDRTYSIHEKCESYLNLNNIAYFNLENYIFSYSNGNINILNEASTIYFDWNDFNELNYKFYAISSSNGSKYDSVGIGSLKINYNNSVIYLYLIENNSKKEIYSYDIEYSILITKEYFSDSDYIYLPIGGKYVPSYFSDVQSIFLALDPIHLKMYSVNFKKDNNIFHQMPDYETDLINEYYLI